MGNFIVLEVADDGAKVDGLVVVGSVFGDFSFLHDAEAKTLKGSRPAARGKGDNLAKDLGYIFAAKIVQVGIHQLA